MMTEIVSLRELLAQATPGEWKTTKGTSPARDVAWLVYKETRYSLRVVSESDREEDAELIASAVNALPALLDRLEAAERRVGVLKGALDGLPRGGESP
jgi:hypothetical protein